MLPTLTAILAACPVCAAGAEAESATLWPLLLIAPFAIAAATAIAVVVIRRRAR